MKTMYYTMSQLERKVLTCLVVVKMYFKILYYNEKPTWLKKKENLNSYIRILKIAQNFNTLFTEK